MEQPFLFSNPSESDGFIAKWKRKTLTDVSLRLDAAAAVVSTDVMSLPPLLPHHRCRLIVALRSPLPPLPLPLPYGIHEEEQMFNDQGHFEELGEGEVLQVQQPQLRCNSRKEQNN